MDVLIVGAGGHGKVVLDILRLGGKHNPIGFIDADTTLAGTTVGGLPVFGPPNQLPKLAKKAKAAIIAIGDNRTRRSYATMLAEQGFELIARFTRLRASHQARESAEMSSSPPERSCALMRELQIPRSSTPPRWSIMSAKLAMRRTFAPPSPWADACASARKRLSGLGRRSFPAFRSENARSSARARWSLPTFRRMRLPLEFLQRSSNLLLNLLLHNKLQCH